MVCVTSNGARRGASDVPSIVEISISICDMRYAVCDMCVGGNLLDFCTMVQPELPRRDGRSSVRTSELDADTNYDAVVLLRGCVPVCSAVLRKRDMITPRLVIPSLAKRFPTQRFYLARPSITLTHGQTGFRKHAGPDHNGKWENGNQENENENGNGRRKGGGGKGSNWSFGTPGSLETHPKTPTSVLRAALRFPCVRR